MPAAVLGEAEVEGGVELVGPQAGEVAVLLLPAVLPGLGAGRVTSRRKQPTEVP